MFMIVLKSILLMMFILISVAFVTLLERKILGYMQKRKGPNKLGFKGILQPFSDAVKLLVKESLLLNLVNLMIYLLSPVVILLISLFLWVTYPSFLGGLEVSLPIIFILCCLSAGVYPILGSGWSSNSKYSMLGSLRAVAQTISYEVSLAILLLSLVVVNSSFSLKKLFSDSMLIILILFPIAILWLISALAETNRTPFDFAEGESELVSGFNTEYSASGFVLFFLAEYSSILFMSLFFSVLFLGSVDLFLNLSFLTSMLVILFIWVRGTLPRLRYDKLMELAWKIMLPLSLMYLLLFTGVSLMIYIFSV
uniref:NADH-ubiquinone oxidoreductase chain 1 n=1 Tax=Armadillidium vulgare TaxID=13347 RepID=A0A221SE66_ARMVU|nr:NADH dehydrogenase subunit 1 [Armadillidium vulgare]